MKEVAVDRRIEADPGVVYDLVSDVTRMGQWSPETVSCRWLGGATSAVVGARFKGSNRHGWHRWSTTCAVTAAERGRRFAFEVGLMGLPIAKWEYDIDAQGNGCRVTERWIDARPGWMEKLSPLATGVSDRAEHNRQTMTDTLTRLKQVAEASDRSV
jgi:hypothetical protein